MASKFQKTVTFSYGQKTGIIRKVVDLDGLRIGLRGGGDDYCQCGDERLHPVK